MSEFWFARRFPVGHPRNAMAPVTREGWLAFAYWTAAMVVGSAIFLWLTLAGSFLGGLAVFIAVTILATWLLLSLVNRRGGPTRTVEDYRRMQGGSPT